MSLFSQKMCLLYKTNVDFIFFEWLPDIHWLWWPMVLLEPRQRLIKSTQALLFILISHYIPFFYLLLSSPSLFPGVLASLFKLSLLLGLSPPPSSYLCEHSSVCICVCVCVCVWEEGGEQHLWLEEEVREKEVTEGKREREAHNLLEQHTPFQSHR